MKFPKNFILDSTISDSNNLIGQSFGKLTCIAVAGYLATDSNRVIYLFNCECGEQHLTSARDVKSGKVKSCGCIRRQITRDRGKNNKKSEHKTALTKYYNTYKSSASRRELAFTLSLEEFKEITSSNCHYCGIPPSRPFAKTWKTSVNTYMCNGIDRKDNTKGYTFSNSLPCCSICNHAKHDLPYDTFIMWIKNLTTYTNERETKTIS